MASKYTKVPVNEAGPFTVSNNLFSLQMDDLAVSNLAESYLDLEVSFADATGNQATGTVELGDRATGAVYSGASFIKNFRMEAEKQPFVCEERYRNRLGETMRQFYKGEEERAANEIYGNGKIKLDATTNRGHCLIPLSDIAPVGNLLYPNYAMGKTALKLELEDRAPLAYKKAIPGGKIRTTVAINDVTADPAARPAFNLFRVTQPFPDQATANTYFATKVCRFQATLNGAAIDEVKTVTTVTFTAGAGGGTVDLAFNTAVNIPGTEALTGITITITDAGTFACDDLPNAGAAPINVYTITATGKVPGDFTVGGFYQMGYFEQTTAGVANADQYKYVGTLNKLVSAVPNSTTATDVDLTFQNMLFILPNGKTATYLFANQVTFTATALNYTVHKCDLVLAKPIKWSPMKEFAYQTMSLEMVNMPQTTDWRRQYELEPECDALMLLTPTASLLSIIDNASSYRNAINSIDTTTEDVRITNGTNGSLYYDMLLKNLDDVKNLQPLNGLNELVVITERVPPPQGSLNNVIEFRVSSTNNMSAKVVYLYKRLNKAMKL